MGPEQLYTRNDRHLDGVKLQVNDGTTQVINAPTSPKTVYVDMTSSQFFAKPGETVTASVAYTGSWMQAYAYIDYNNDGKFQATVNDDFSIAEGSDLVSFSFYGGSNNDSGVNSAGTAISGQARNTLSMPAFTIPANTEPGMYRMRYKVDWDNINPAGASTIISNGGGYIDVMLDVHNDNVAVNASQLNGDIVLASDESALQGYTANYAEPLMVKDIPAPGFVQYGFTLKYGYNVNAVEQLDDNGNPNWIEINVPYTAIAADGTYTIPAEYIRGSQVSIKGDMQQEQLYTVKVVGAEGKGGVIYANIETADGGTVYATQFFSAEQLTPIAVEGCNAAITIEERIITVTYTEGPAPCTPIASLSELKNYKLYQVSAKSGEGYWAYNGSITDDYISLRGMTNHSYNNLPGNSTVANIYKEEVDPFDETVVWRIFQEGGKYYMYQPARKAYVTRNGRDYKFTETKTALDGIRANSGDYEGTFGIHAGGGYSDGSTNFACIVTNEAAAAVRNWRWDDHGSVVYLIENPNVYTVNYLVEVTGNDHGGITFEGADYVNDDNFTSTRFLTDADLTAKAIDHYTTSVAVDSENGKIMVEYIGDETTAIVELPAAENSAIIYDLYGRPVHKATKGVYIKNGKKIIQ